MTSHFVRKLYRNSKKELSFQPNVPLFYQFQPKWKVPYQQFNWVWNNNKHFLGWKDLPFSSTKIYTQNVTCFSFLFFSFRKREIHKLKHFRQLFVLSYVVVCRRFIPFLNSHFLLMCFLLSIYTCFSCFM